MNINPYLNFAGNTEEVFNFYKSVFGGEFLALQRFSDTDAAGNIPEADKNKIMHIAFPLSEHTILMGTDSLESMGQKLNAGNNFYLSLDTETKEDADRIFSALGAGGVVEMPMQVTFWGSYYGSFRDKFGIQWMISCEHVPATA